MSQEPEGGRGEEGGELLSFLRASSSAKRRATEERRTEARKASGEPSGEEETKPTREPEKLTGARGEAMGGKEGGEREGGAQAKERRASPPPARA